MNKAQMEAKERGLTAIARKVYEATPIETPWELNRIVANVHQNGCTAEYRVIQGCLAYLRDERLVKEVAKNIYQRVAKREKPEKQPEPEQVPMKLVLPEKTQDDDPIKKIGDLAASLRSQSTALSQLATQLEDVALEIQGVLEKNAEAANRLRALQSLLKD